ncbi:MAG: hypothetical protein RL282_1636 [Bacteroidota bacterium]
MNGIQQIGFSRSVGTTDGRNSFGKVEMGLVIIPELKKADMFDSEQNRAVL